MTDQLTVEPDKDEELQEETQDDPGQNSEGGENTEKSQAAEAEGSDTEGEEAEQDEQGGKFEDTDTPTIPVRPATSYIIERQKRKAERITSQQPEVVATPPVTTTEPDDEEVEDTSVSREVKRQLSPVLNTFKQQEDERELQTLLATEPESKGYERAIRAFMKHPAWAQVPPKYIYAALAFDHAQTIGAKRKQVADKEVAHMRGAGSTRRPTKVKSGSFPSADEIDKMSDEELDDLAHKARTGQFVSKKS